MSDDELSVIKAGASDAGLALGAWLRELAVRSADRPEWDLAASRPAVVGQLLRVRVDVAQVLHAAGGDIERRVVRDALRRLDALIGEAVSGPPG